MSTKSKIVQPKRLPKNYAAKLAMVDSAKLYGLSEAVELIKKMPKADRKSVV